MYSPFQHSSRSFLFYVLPLALCLPCDGKQLLAQPGFKKYFTLPGIGPTNTWAFPQTCASGDGKTYVMGGYMHPGAQQKDKGVVLCTDDKGEVLWAKKYFNADHFRIWDILPLSNGQYFALTYSGAGANGYHFGMMGLSAQGDMLWSKLEDGYLTIPQGLVRLSDGILFYGYIDTPASDDHVVVLKTDDNGIVLWQRIFSLDTEHALNIVAADFTPGGDLLFAGSYFNLANGMSRPFLLKLSTDGDLIWCNTYLTSGGHGFRDLTVLKDGTIAMMGYDPGKIWVLHLDPAGEVLASNELGIANTYTDISQVERSAGGDKIVFVDYTKMAQVSPDGVVDWAYQYSDISWPAMHLFQIRALPDSGFLASGIYDPNSLNHNVLAMFRMNKDGIVDGCCHRPVNFTRNAVPVKKLALGIQQQTYQLSFAGYTATVEDVESEDFSICQPIPLAPDFTLSRDTVCPGECVTAILPDSIPADVQFSWQIKPPVAGMPADPFCFSETGAYSITRVAKLGGCIDSATQILTVGERPDRFPNVFTPDGDGVNDVFRPLLYCPAEVTRFSVYNRWGQEVFRARQPDEGWDGEYGGRQVPSDVYAWVVEYTSFGDGGQKRNTVKGSVTLIR